MGEISTVTLLDGVTYDIKDAKSRMAILKYGSSTWTDFITAYDNKAIVYCRASSNSNPGTGSQTRLAFMAYVNNETTPTEVEFQYYRSVSSHSDSQQGDQVYVYKLNKTTGWSVTTRNAFTKVIAGTGLTSSFTTGTSSSITLSLDTINASTVVYDNTASGLTATDVQDAIDEVKTSIPTVINDLSDVDAYSPSKGDVLVYDGASIIAKHGWFSTDATWIGYDNSNSGLSADYVGGAIDEIANNYLPIDPQGSDNPLVSNLELEKNDNPRYYTKSTSIDCTEADNGISSGTYYAGLFNVDTNDRIIGTFETLTSSNGAVSSRLTARNSGTGTQVSNILTLGVYNDGSPFVSITNNDATREAWQIALGLAFAPGNSCNLAGMTCPGHLTSNKGSVVFYIPLAKPIASTVSNVSVSSTNCEIRHSDGGYIGSGDLRTRGTISSSIAAGRQGVTVTLSLFEASTFTNNAPITIRFYSTSTLTFS